MLDFIGVIRSMTTRVPAEDKEAWLRALDDMFTELQRLTTRVQELPTVESRVSLEAEAEQLVRRRYSIRAEENWRTWFRAATAWCRLHHLEPMSTFEGWSKYRRVAEVHWMWAWEDWAEHFLQRLTSRTADRGTEDALLWHMWRDWEARMREAEALGWLAREPRRWREVVHGIRGLRRPPKRDSLAEFFDAE